METLCYTCYNSKFVIPGFLCQMPELFRKRGTMRPPAFKPLYRGTGALCAAAWLIVAEAYPCTEYSGSGTETVRYPTKDNWKLSYI